MLFGLLPKGKSNMQLASGTRPRSTMAVCLEVLSVLVCVLIAFGLYLAHNNSICLQQVIIHVATVSCGLPPAFFLNSFQKKCFFKFLFCSSLNQFVQLGVFYLQVLVHFDRPNVGTPQRKCRGARFVRDHWGVNPSPKQENMLCAQ